MSIDGLYHVYCLGTNLLKDNPRPFSGEVSIIRVTSDGGTLRVDTNAEPQGWVELSKKSGGGADKQYVWEKGSDWKAQARFVDDIVDCSSKLLVGWLRRDKLVDTFVAIKEEFDPGLLTNAPEYKMYYRKNDNVRDLSVSLNGEDLRFSFQDPEGSGSDAKTPGKQRPGRFNADRQTGSEHSIVGFLLPRFIKVKVGAKMQDRAVLVGHLVKGKLGAKDYGPGGDPEDIEPFVAVATTPPKPNGEECSPS